MGSFVFKWPYPANDVHVTGTFDDWGKSEQLNKVGDVWEKEVNLSSADDKILYKFVVDDKWVIDLAAPIESDGHNNDNNVLYPQDIKKHASKPTTEESTGGSSGIEGAAAGVGGVAALGAGAAAISSVSPDSTTAKMAGDVPVEEHPPTISSAAPDSTTSALAGNVPVEEHPPTISSTAPDSTTSALAGNVPVEEHPTTISSAAPDSTASAMAGDVPLERNTSPPGAFPETPAAEPESFNVAPIPASEGMANPISVPAGEKLPETVEGKTLDSTATTSKEAYEGDASSAFPPTATGEDPTMSVKPIPATSGIGNPITLPAGEKVPDSSAVTSNTVDSTATTSKEAYEGDASSAFPTTATGEDPTLSVKPIPATSGIGNPITLPAGEKVPDSSAVTSNTVDSTATTSKEAYEHAGETAMGVVGGTALGAGAISAFSKHDGEKKNLIPESSLPMGGEKMDTMDAGPTISSAAAGSTTAGLAGAVPLEKKRQGMVIDPTDAPTTEAETTAPAVPALVTDSITKSGEGAEAAASPEAVEEKSAMEKELLSKTTSSEAAGEPASAAENQSSYYGLATAVPGTVEKSMSEAHAVPEAASQAAVVSEKSAMESELLTKVKPEEGAGEPAPTVAAATSETAPVATESTAVAADPALADEPAVKMMQAEDTPASTTAPAATAAAAAATATTTTATTDGAADVKKAEPAAPKEEIRKRSEIRDISPGAADPKAKAAMATPTKPKPTSSAAATPTKPTTSTTSSPAVTTASGEMEKKKKKHRISGFFKKIFD